MIQRSIFAPSYLDTDGNTQDKHLGIFFISITNYKDMEAKTIYKILNTFEKQLDAEDFDLNFISPERLKISQTRRDRYLQMLI